MLNPGLLATVHETAQKQSRRVTIHAGWCGPLDTTHGLQPY